MALETALAADMSIEYKVLLLVYKAFTSSKSPDMVISRKRIRATPSSLKVNILDIPKTCNNGYNAKAIRCCWTSSVE